jgi:SAM-dependent methyltransferase
MNTKTDNKLPQDHPYGVSISKMIFQDRKKAISLLRNALDKKYGNLDYSKDARSLCEKEFNETFNRLVSKMTQNSNKILITGANDGYEIEILSKDEGIHALDLSRTAIERLASKFKNVVTHWEDLQEMKFPDNYFDGYICMRTVTSSNVDLRTAVSESCRVTKDKANFIFSIPNGYWIDGKIVKGMYVTKTGKIDKKLPYKQLDDFKKVLEEFNLKYEVIEVPSEIIVIVSK